MIWILVAVPLVLLVIGAGILCLFFWLAARRDLGRRGGADRPSAGTGPPAPPPVPADTTVWGMGFIGKAFRRHVDLSGTLGKVVIGAIVLLLIVGGVTCYRFWHGQDAAGPDVSSPEGQWRVKVGDSGQDPNV